MSSIAATTPATAVATQAPASGTSAVASSGLSALAADMAASAPVQTDRVAQIKSAIKDGTYPILPARIADQFIAFKLGWDTHESA